MLNMKDITSENEVLKKILWPSDKTNMLGNMIFSSISDDMANSTEVAVSRQKSSLEIFYSTYLVDNPEDKNYLVKIYYNRSEIGLSLDTEKTSPEIKTSEDIDKVLESIRNTILLMNKRPAFFPTGVNNLSTDSDLNDKASNKLGNI